MSKTEEFIKYERENLKKKTFSINTFVRLMQTYLNDPEFESHIMKTKGDKAYKVLDYPVKKFRKIIMNVLLDFGVEKKDAETILDKYEFKSKDLEGMYDFMSDFLYQYLKTGRRFVLLQKEDLVASVIADEVEETVKTYKLSPENPIRTKKHKKLKVSSSCPKWEKETLDSNNKVIKSMEKILEKI